MKYLAILLCLPLAGCDLADILEGKPSAFQAEQERRAALTLPVMAVAPEPSRVAAPEPYVPPAPVCVPRWRVLDCVDGAEVWL